MKPTDIPYWFLFGIAIPVRNFLLHCGAGFAEEAAVYSKYGFHKVVWIEANSKIAEKAREKLIGFSNQELISAALWDKANVELKFYSASNFHSGSLMNPKEHTQYFPQISFSSDEHVRTQRLDALDIEIPFSSVLVLDLQGAEHKALLGATKVLERFDYIYSEFSLVELYEGGSVLNSLEDILGESYQLLIKTESKENGYGNALFVRGTSRKGVLIRISWKVILNIISLRYELGRLKQLILRKIKFDSDRG